MMNPFSAPPIKADPIVTEIIRNGFIAVTEEMKSNLMRTAYSMIIYEALDFTVGLFDADGEILSIGLGLPMFIRGISDTIKAKVGHFGRENLKEGDVLLTNDAYVTGSHLNHLTFSVPIFHGGDLVGFSGCMAHWADIGGTLDGMTTDIYSEGLQIPFVKIWREGVPNEDVLAIIRMNVRLPERAMGDLKAQIAAVRTGEKRFLELIRKYGLTAMKAAIASIFDQSEIAAREAVREIPDGTYEAESFMDDDGVDVGKPVPLKVRVIVAGDEMTIDLSALSDQVRGFYNSGETAGLSCAGVAFKCLTSPTSYPINSGSFRPLKVILPPGKVVSALKPAPMRWWMTYPMTVVDTIFKALSPAIPDRVIAGHHADLVCALIHGRHQPENRMFLYLGGLIGGGWGAKHNEDGVSATICINDGDTHNGPSEQVEAKYPLLVESYGLREDSGGAGKHRGGLGTRQVVRALRDIMFNAQIERVKCRPWGLYDGLSGSGNEVFIERGDGVVERYPSGKVLARVLRAGDAYVLASGGGGGFGSPLERAPEDVARDVAQGYISRRSAHALYGVLFSPDGRAVDTAATAALRARMSALGLPRDEAEASPGHGNASVSPPEIEPWHGPAGKAAGGIVIEADRPTSAEEVELEQWRNEIRWAGLLRVRCGCCG
jgi:N-methylhydantoinase B